MWSEEFVARPGIKVYHVLIIAANKIPADDADNTKENKIASLKLLYFRSYNELILVQEDTVWFDIIKILKTKANMYRDARLARKKLLRKFEPTTGAYTILCKKFAKCEIDDVTRNPK